MNQLPETESRIINDLALALSISQVELITFFVKQGIDTCIASQDALINMNSIRTHINDNAQAHLVCKFLWEGYIRGNKKQSGIVMPD